MKHIQHVPTATLKQKLEALVDAIRVLGKALGEDTDTHLWAFVMVTDHELHPVRHIISTPTPTGRGIEGYITARIDLVALLADAMKFEVMEPDE